MMTALPHREALVLPAGQVRGDGEVIKVIHAKLLGTCRERTVCLGPVTRGGAVAGSTHRTSVVDEAEP